MKILKLFKRINPNLIPFLVVGAGLILSGIIAYSFSPRSPLIVKQSETSLAKVIQPTQAVVSSPTPEITSAVLGVQTQTVSPKPTLTKAVVVTQTTSSSNSNSQSVSAPTQTPTPQPENPTQVPTQALATTTVSVEIKTPDAPLQFSVDFKDGMNVCDVLQKAKDDGKIHSVTFDDSYMATLHSKYVSEINGFSNNWTFTVNGNAPLGCSLSQPKPNDTIVWKFG